MVVMNFLSNTVTLAVFELEQCSLHINGVELDQDYTGDQIPPYWLVVTIKSRYNDSSGHTVNHKSLQGAQLYLQTFLN